MRSRSEVHELLAQAAYFERSGDPYGAICRAKDAVMAAPDEELAVEAQLAVERYELAARKWRTLVDERESEHRVFELRGQDLPAPPLELVHEAPPRRWSWIARLVRPRLRVATAP